MLASAIGHPVNGLAHHPGEELPDPRRPKPCDPKDGKDGDPVYIANGEFYWEKTFLPQETTIPLRLYLRYSVMVGYEGPAGCGWNFSYNSRLYETDDAAKPIVVLKEDGRRMTFETNGTPNVFRSRDTENELVSVNGDGTYTLKTRKQTEFHYDSTGRLTRIADGKGAELRFSFNPAGKVGVVAIPRKSNLTNAVVVSRDHQLQRAEEFLAGVASGKFLEFRYDGTGHLTNVMDQAGRNVTLSYFQPSGDLKRVLDVNNQAYDFTYDSVRRLETYIGRGCSDCSIRRNYYVADNDDRILRQTQGMNEEGDEVRFDWGGTVDAAYYVRDALSGDLLGIRKVDASFTTDVFGQMQVASRSVDLPGPADWVQNNYFDPNTGRLAAEQTPNGALHFYGYDSSGNLLAETNQISGVTNLLRLFQYDARNNRTRQTIWRTDRPTELFVTVYEYDLQNKLTADKRVKNPTAPTGSWEFASTRYDYYPSGLLQRRTDPRTNAIQYEYNAAGLLTREFDPASPTYQTTYGYDLRGNRVAMTNALGNAWLYEYDDLGRLTRTINPLGAEDLFAYVDANLVEVETGKLGTNRGRITRYGYDGLNNQIRVARVDDAGVERFQRGMAYDTEGRVLRVTNALNQVETFDYFYMGWLLADSRPWSNKVGSVLQYDYDAGGRRVVEADPLLVITTNGFDGLDQLVSRTEALGTPVQRNTSYKYNALGNIVEIRYSDGTNTFITSYAYDALGRKTGISGDRAYPRIFEYDDSGNLIAETDGNTNRTQYVYDAYNRRTRVIYPDRNDYLPDGNDAVFEYDLVGNMVKKTDGRGVQRFTHYDALNRPMEQSIPVGRGDTLPGGTNNWWLNNSAVLQRSAYNLWQQQVFTSNIVGAVSYARYDRFGRLTNSVDAAGLSLTYRHDALDNVTNLAYPVVIGNTQATSIVWIFSTNSGRLLQNTTDRAGNRTSYTYDKRFRVLTEITPLGGTNRYTYDALSRLTATTNAVGDVRQFAYDQFDQRTKIIHPDHIPVSQERIEYFYYDQNGEVTNHAGAAASPASFSFDPAGNLQTLRDGNDNATTWSYSSVNRVKRKTYLDGTYEEYGYDGAGNLASKRDARNISTTFTRSSFDVVTNVSYSIGVSNAYLHDAAGRITRMLDSTGTNDWSYDTAGRVITNLQGGAGVVVSYAYDPEGHRTARWISTLGSAGVWSTVYSYDFSGRLATLNDSEFSAGPFRYVWTNGNLLAELRTPEGMYLHNDYDKLGRLIQRKALNSTNDELSLLTYAYDKAGQIVANGLSGGKTNRYAYDEKRQLIQANRTDALGTPDPAFSYGYYYDAAGNWISNSTPSGSKVFASNPLNQYTNVISSSSSTPLGFDQGGNLESYGANSFSWDAENRLKNSTNGTFSAEFAYDGRGRRVVSEQKSPVAVTNLTVFDGSIPVEILGPGNTVSIRMARGLDLSGTLERAGGIGGILGISLTNGLSKHYAVSDILGNVRGLFASNGVPTATYDYSPFGENVVSTGVAQPFTFASKGEIVGLGIRDFHARMYSPSLGRWLSRDPLQERVSPLLYRYVRNDPINAYDAFGLRDCSKYEDKFDELVWESAGAWAKFAAGIFVIPKLYKLGWARLERLGISHLDNFDPEEIARVRREVHAITHYGYEFSHWHQAVLDVFELNEIMHLDKELRHAGQQLYKCRHKRRENPCSPPPRQEDEKLPPPAHYTDMKNGLESFGREIAKAGSEIQGLDPRIRHEFDAIERRLRDLARRSRQARDGLECWGSIKCDPPMERPIGDEGIEFYWP